jgi:hypothetical protein
MSRSSRYAHRNRNKRLAKQARTIPIPGHIDYGDGEDDGKFYQCWNCKMVCDVDRDELGGPDDRGYRDPKKYTLVGEDYSTPVKDLANSKDYTIHGGTQYRRTRYQSDVQSGCPFCGTLNWRGDYP